MYNNNAEFSIALLCLSYIAFVKALDPAICYMLALLRSNRRDVQTMKDLYTHDVTNFEFDLRCFLLEEEKGVLRENHRGMIRKLKKLLQILRFSPTATDI